VKKPLEREFEVSDAGIRHRPADEKFVSYSGKPSDGSWRDGHLDTAGEYDSGGSANGRSEAAGEVHRVASQLIRHL
jgi:hypothetical protein